MFVYIHHSEWIEESIYLFGSFARLRMTNSIVRLCSKLLREFLKCDVDKIITETDANSRDECIILSISEYINSSWILRKMLLHDSFTTFLEKIRIYSLCIFDLWSMSCYNSAIWEYGSLSDLSEWILVVTQDAESLREKFRRIGWEINMWHRSWDLSVS